MIEITNFRISRLDKYNVRFEEYRDVENPQTKEVEKKWVVVPKYYSDVTQCLEGIKKHILTIMADGGEINDYKVVLEQIAELQNAFVKWKLETTEIVEV